MGDGVKIFRIIILFFLCSCSVKILAYDGSGSISSGGKTRSFVFHAKGTTVAQNLPILFVFHGDGGSGESIKSSTGFNAIADVDNFIVIYPNADTDGGGWHRAIDQPKDVQFTSDMIDYFCSTYHIDAKRVYATGVSAGGFMTYNLAVNLPGKVAAFAPIAGNMYANNGNYSYFSSAAFRPVAICHIHGALDVDVPYPDPDGVPGAWSEWPLTHFSHYSCNKDTYTLPNITLATGVSKLTFCTGTAPGSKEITLISVAGKAHESLVVPGFNPYQTAWNFVKNYALTTALSCAAEPEVPTHAQGTIHTQGNQIMSPCNEVFIPRGVNYSLADDWEFPSNMNGDPTGVNNELSAEIIKARPNTVRIEWFANRQSSFQPYSVADLDMVVSRFKNAGIVSIIDLHDVTCSNNYTTFNSVILPWWKQQSVLNLLNKHKGYVIANIANEFGYVNWAGNVQAGYDIWLAHYKSVITELRAAGIQVPFMIDAPDCGQSLNFALQAGPALKQQDPLHNIIMSAHAYWYSDDAAAMETKAQQIAAADFPVVLGEIANIQDATGPCSNAIDAYTSLLQSCQNHNIGWLSWTWTDDQCSERRMTPNGSFANLTAYGNVIVNNANFGLKDHAPLMKVACLINPLPVKLTSFQAMSNDEGEVQLNWETAVEKDFKEFQVQRSQDGINFINKAVILPNPTHKYAYTDKNLNTGQYYYRLKMVDIDESYAFSRLVSATLESEDNVFVFPSPAMDYIKIQVAEQNYPANVYIFDSAGKRVISQTLRNRNEKIKVAGLKEGLYIVKVNDRVIGRIVVGDR